MLLRRITALLGVLSIALLGRVALLRRVLLVLLGRVATSVRIESACGIVTTGTMRVAMGTVMRFYGENEQITKNSS